MAECRLGADRDPDVLHRCLHLPDHARARHSRAQRAASPRREELRRAVGFSVADEIAKLDQLKKAGSITDDEFARVRAKLVQ